MPPQDRGATTPAFTLRVNGSDLPPAVRGEVARIVVEEGLDCAGSFAVRINSLNDKSNELKWTDSPLLQPGNEVQIRLGYREAVETVIVGEVTGLELSIAPGTGVAIIMRGHDRLHRFRRGRRTRSYLQVKDSDVARQIAGDLRLTPEVDDSDEVHPYLLQMNQTDIDFLLSRARAIGFDLQADEKTLRFRRSRHNRGKVATLDFTHGLREFWGYLSTADQVSEVVVRGWDPKMKQPLVGRAQPADVTGAGPTATVGPAAAERLFGTRTLSIVEQPVTTQHEADLLARGLINDLALDYVTAEATATGNPLIRAGSVVELGGLGQRFNGAYYVSHVRHVFEGEFSTHMRLRRNAA
jgi:phage protein D